MTELATLSGVKNKPGLSPNAHLGIPSSEWKEVANSLLSPENFQNVPN
jgi:hypothetical protein